MFIFVLFKFKLYIYNKFLYNKFYLFIKAPVQNTLIYIKQHFIKLKNH